MIYMCVGFAGQANLTANPKGLLFFCSEKWLEKKPQGILLQKWTNFILMTYGAFSSNSLETIDVSR